ncbi:MAG TPA: tetratricopeptide repeat protein [Gemmatimonadales bacterium]|nr:tetratricopeptide repeat protein [Gemmatimonadales bacterium]
MTPDANPERLVREARERFALQDYYGAVHLLDEVIESGRAFADAHHLLGLSLSLLGQPDRALTAFDRALELNPRYLEAIVHRGLVLNQLGRTEEAEACFRRAAAQEGAAPGRFTPHVAAKLANQHAALGEAYAEIGALAEAVDQYRRATVLGPTFADLRYRLARLLLEANNPLEARDELEQVLRARPGFIDAQASLGLAHYLSGDAQAARDVWRACLERQPENARVEAYLSMIDRAVE